MGASLSLSISESDLDKADNTSKVKATLYVKSSSGSWNGSSRYGYISIDGSKHTFHHSFNSNTTTTLASFTKTVKHDSNGGGKITIKGYYETGTSAGNISTSKTYTLKTIDRTFTVKYSANGGKDAPSSQTKTYGKTLTLKSGKPTRAGYTFLRWNTQSNGGGTNYNPGGSYAKNANVTLYAQWSKITATATFTSDKLGFSNFTSSMDYANVSKAPDCPSGYLVKNGYHFEGWLKDAIKYDVGDVIKAANTNPTNMYFEADEVVNQYYLEYRCYTVGTTYVVLSRRTVTFGETITFPTFESLHPEEHGIVIPEDKEFKGWTGAGANYNVPGKQYVWRAFPDANGTVGCYYAYIDDKANSTVTYYEPSSITSDGVTVDTMQSESVVYGDDYRVKRTELDKIVNDYEFTGYWKIGSMPEFSSWQDYSLLNKNVFPFNFNPTFINNYNEEYDIVKEGYILQDVIENQNLYPVYKDITGPGLRFEKGNVDYISAEDYASVDPRIAYYLYLSGQSREFNITMIGEYFVAAWKLRCISTNVLIDTSESICEVYNEDGTKFDTYTSDEFIVNDRIENDEKFYYITMTNLQQDSSEPAHGKLNSAKKYTLRLFGIKDNSGKETTINDVVISPPNILRDISASGKVVSYFAGAPETPTYGGDKEFWINGDLVTTGKIYTKTISVSDLTTEEAKVIYGDKDSGNEGSLKTAFRTFYPNYTEQQIKDAWDDLHKNERLNLDGFIDWMVSNLTGIPNLNSKVSTLNSGKDTRIGKLIDGWTPEGEEYHIGVAQSFLYLCNIINTIAARVAALDGGQSEYEDVTKVKNNFNVSEGNYWPPEE